MNEPAVPDRNAAAVRRSRKAAKTTYIDPKDWVPGKIYGTRRGPDCPKYLYTEHVLAIKEEVRFAATGQAVDITSPWRKVFMKWSASYDKYLHRSAGWNQMLHDLMELTAGESPNWYGRLCVQDSKPENQVRFAREIRTLFDPAAVIPETIDWGWQPCMLARTRPGDIAYPGGWYPDGLHGTVPGFRRLSIILSPWTEGNQPKETGPCQDETKKAP